MFLLTYTHNSVAIKLFINTTTNSIISFSKTGNIQITLFRFMNKKTL